MNTRKKGNSSEIDGNSITMLENKKLKFMSRKRREKLF